eukprot:scaffold1221_cov207-Amphora_coffeaeformis.AAC.40
MDKCGEPKFSSFLFQMLLRLKEVAVWLAIMDIKRGFAKVIIRGTAVHCKHLSASHLALRMYRYHTAVEPRQGRYGSPGIPRRVIEQRCGSNQPQPHIKWVGF